MLPRKEGALKLVRAEASPDAPGLLTVDPQNTYASYDPVPPARYKLKVVREKVPGAPLATFDLVLRPDVYVSFVACLKDGKPSVTMVDDTFDPATATQGQVTVRNFIADSNMQVTYGTAQSPPVAFGSAEKLNGLPLRETMFEIQGSSTSGQTWKGSCVVEFSASTPRGTILITSDHAGNLRARAAMDGHSPIADQADSGAAAAGGVAAPAVKN